MAWGLAASETPDKDGEIWDYEFGKPQFQKWSQDFLARTTAAGQEFSLGNVRLMHQLEIAGKVVKIEYNDEAKQVWIGGEPKNAEIWDQLKRGFITAYSLGGQYAWLRPDEQHPEFNRYGAIIGEMSWVDNPSNPDATFAYVKADGSTELRKFAPRDPQAVIDKVKAEAALKAAEFADICKGGRDEKGRFVTDPSGPVHEGLVEYGYEHTRSGKRKQHGTEAETTFAVYTHPSGHQVTLHDNGDWEHDNGHGKRTAGIGRDSLAVHMERCHAKKALTAGDTFTFLKAKWTAPQAQEWISKHVSGEVLMSESYEAFIFKAQGEPNMALTDAQVDTMATLIGAKMGLPYPLLTKIPAMSPEQRKAFWDYHGLTKASIEQLAREAEFADEKCKCTCAQCAAGDCKNCSMRGCADPNCKAAKATKGSGKTKRVSGEDLPPSAFLIVGDPDDTSTWKLPVKFSSDEKTKSHIRNAIARFDQMKDVSSEEKASAWKKLVRLAREHGIHVADEGDSDKSAKAMRSELVKATIGALSKAAELNKSMYHVGALAQILMMLKDLQIGNIFEAQFEGDARDNAIAEELGVHISGLIGVLKDMVEEETDELMEVPALKAAIQKGEVDMKQIEALVKAAIRKGSHGHHKAAATHHAGIAALHKAMHDHHTGMAQACKADVGSGEPHSPHSHHVAKAHHHNAMAALHKAYSEHHAGMAGQDDGDADMKAAATELEKEFSGLLEPLTKAVEGFKTGQVSADAIKTAVEGVVKDVVGSAIKASVESTVKASVDEALKGLAPTLVKAAGPTLMSRDGKKIEIDVSKQPEDADLWQ